jgi:hypothetical protein
VRIQKKKSKTDQFNQNINFIAFEKLAELSITRIEKQKSLNATSEVVTWNRSINNSVLVTLKIT